MKKYLLSVILTGLYSILLAQLNYNSFLAENIPGTYTDLGTNGSAISTANQDNANSSAQNIGFTFDFNGSSFTQFVLNTNGFVKLGNTPPSSTTLFFTGTAPALPGNGRTGGPFNSTNAADVNLLVPFNHDLTAGGTSTEYRVYTDGTAPNRVCTIQFKNVKDKTTSPYNQFDSLNFQIKLYETTNNIEFIFGNSYASSDSSRFKSAACGIKGNNSTTTNQIVVVSKGSTQDYSAAAFLNGNYPTTSNTFNFGNNNPGNGLGPNGSRPMVDPGRTYRFKPALLYDLRVNNVFTMGDVSEPWGQPVKYSASVSNSGINAGTNVKVYLKITGANTHTDSAAFTTINPLTDVLVNFSDYTPENLGVNNVEVYVLPDSNNDNNSLNYRQEVGRKTMGHADTTQPAAGNVGYPAGAGGSILQRYEIIGKRRVSHVWIFISPEPANVGNLVYACVVSSNGTFLARSANFPINASHLGTWQQFEINQNFSGNIIRPPLINNGTFYAGLVAPANPSTRYNPVGHDDNGVGVQNTYFYLGLVPPTPTVLAPTDYFLAPGGAITQRSFIKADVHGNSLSIEDISLTDPQCVDPARTVEVTLKNNDTLAVDFSDDNLKLKISTTGAITQVDSTIITSGMIMPDSQMTFTVTSALDLSLAGAYDVDLEASTVVEVDTASNYESFTINVVDTPGVDLTVFPDSVICFGDSFIFTAVPFTAGSAMYQWKVNGVNQGSPTNDDTFLPNLVWGDTVSVDMITDHCTTGTFTVPSNEIIMKINPKPRNPNGIVGADTVIENTTKNYTLGIVNGSTYLWDISGGTLLDTTGNAVTAVWDGPNTSAFISVTETNGGCSYTNTVPVVIISVVGIDEERKVGIGEAYPNPANQFINIPLYTEGQVDIELDLLDMNGKKLNSVFSGQIDKSRVVELDVSQMNNGIYFYRLRTSDGQEVIKRFAVQK